MPTSGVLLLIEAVLPLRFESGPGARFRATSNLTMLLLSQGGAERTADEYRDLLADGGFELMRILPTASPLSLIEARPAHVPSQAESA